MRLVDDYAQYLIRADGHIGHRCGDVDLAGPQHYHPLASQHHVTARLTK